MNKNALIIGGIVIAAVVTLPLAIQRQGAPGATGVSQNWRDYRAPEYAERMGLNLVRRDRFQTAPWGSYEAVVEHLYGTEGVEADHADDLTPLEYHASYDFMLEHAEAPGSKVYLWVNEWDCPMVNVFEEGECVMRFNGVHPDTKYF